MTTIKTRATRWITIKLRQRTNSKVFKDIVWLFVDRFFRMIGGLILIFLLARYLEPSKFGAYNYVLAFMALFRGISSLGLESVVIQELIQNPEKEKEILGSAVAIQLIVSFVILCLFLCISSLVHDSVQLSVMITAIAISNVIQSSRTIEFWFQSRHRSKDIAIAKVIAFISFFSMTLILIYLRAELILFGFTFLLDALILSGALIFLYQIDPAQKISFWRPRKKTITKLLKSSWPLAITTLMIVVYTRVDQIMIAKMMDGESLGFYSLTVRITEAFLFLPVIISNAYFPVIVKLKETSRCQYLNAIEKLYTLMTWSSLLIIFGLLLFRNEIVILLSGEAYLPAASVLSTTAWILLFSFQGTARGKWLVAEGLQRYSYLYVGIGSLTNVLLNFVLIPVSGIKGAALATVIAQATVALVAPLFFRETRISVYMLLSSFFPFRLYAQQAD